MTDLVIKAIEDLYGDTPFSMDAFCKHMEDSKQMSFDDAWDTLVALEDHGWLMATKSGWLCMVP